MVESPRLRTPTVRARLTRSMLGVGAALIALFVLYFPAWQGEQLAADLQSKALVLHRMIGLQVRSALAFADAETPRETFEAAAVDRDVGLIVLYGPRGEILQATGVAPPQPTVGDTAAVRRTTTGVSVVGPVISDEGPRGVLLLELTDIALNAALREARWAAALAGLGALLFLGLAAWLVGRSIGLRVAVLTDVLTQHLNRIADGDLSGLPIGDPRNDELGRLAAACDRMLEKLRSMASQILDTSQQLDGAAGALLEMVDDTRRLSQRAQSSAGGLRARHAAALSGQLDELLGSVADLDGSGAALQIAVDELRGYAQRLRHVAASWRHAGDVRSGGG